VVFFFFHNDIENSLRKYGIICLEDIVHELSYEGKYSKEVLNYLVNYIKKVYLFKKQVKKLLQRQKENYCIISSINSNDLNM